MKYQVLMMVEADSIDAAAEEVAALMTRAEADERIVSDIVVRDNVSPILHFASHS